MWKFPSTQYLVCATRLLLLMFPAVIQVVGE